MKKTLTLLAFLMVTTVSFGQIDLAIKSVDQPSYIKDNLDGTTTNFNIQFTMTNKGDALSAGDTILYSYAVINRDAQPNTIILPLNVRLILLGQDVATGADITSTPLGLNVTGTIEGVVGQTTNVDVAISAYILNRTTNPVDADSTDNVFFHSILWEKQYGASVAGLTYDENIAAYPNPANNVLNVDLLYAANRSVKVELLDLSGKVVTIDDNITSVTPTQFKVDVAGLEKGIYVLKVTNGETVSTRKVTITH